MLDGVSRLAKMLASDESKTRKLGHKYVFELLRLKPGSDICEISYNDILGICKGLYYSLWMQDKLLLQEDTVARIVNLLPLIASRETRVHYMTAMFETLAREWENLDIWRADKFMMLARDFFVKSLLLARKRAMPIRALTDAVFSKIITSDPYSATDLKIHLCTVMKEEITARKEYAAIVHKFYQRTLTVVLNTPKGNNYLTHLLQLLIALARLARSHKSIPHQELSDEALMLSSTYPLQKKTLLRVAKILHTGLDAKKLKKTKQCSKKAPETNAEELKDIERIAVQDGTVETVPDATASLKKKKKRRHKHPDSISSDFTNFQASGLFSATNEQADLVTSPKPTPRNRKRKHENDATRGAEKGLTEQALVTPMHICCENYGSAESLDSFTKQRSRKRRRINLENGAKELERPHVASTRQCVVMPKTVVEDVKREIDSPKPSDKQFLIPKSEKGQQASFIQMPPNASPSNSLVKKMEQTIDLTESDVPVISMRFAEEQVSPFPLLLTEQSAKELPSDSLSKKIVQDEKQGTDSLQSSVKQFPSPNSDKEKRQASSPKALTTNLPIISTLPSLENTTETPTSMCSINDRGDSVIAIAAFDDSLNDSQASVKKRVSFGKVFRKRFSVNKSLTITPTQKSHPDRGILRM